MQNTNGGTNHQWANRYTMIKAIPKWRDRDHKAQA